MARHRRPVSHPTDPGLALVPLTRGYFAVISAVDTATVGRLNWHAVGRDGSVYAVHGNASHGRGLIWLHKEVAALAGIDTSGIVDHFDGNSLNCQRSNLRAATPSQNVWNSRLHENNRSGVKGVHWDASRLRWIVQVQAHGKRRLVGSFISIEDAKAAAESARSSMHGEFANHGN